MKIKITNLCLALCFGLSLASMTGCAGDRYKRSSGEYMDDKTVALRVKEALGDNRQYKFNDVNVAAYRGTVQLSGFVNSGEQKRRAGQIAERVNGVKNVENSISLKN